MSDGAVRAREMRLLAVPLLAAASSPREAAACGVRLEFRDVGATLPFLRCEDVRK